MIFLLALLLAVNTPASSDANNSVTTTLRAKDQALLDAIAPGTKKVWEDALASEAVYVDESGMILDRKAFLDQLTPLPAGASGKLEIANYQAHVSGDLATVIHLDNEQETFHGQNLTAQYLTTETWRRDGDEWKLYLIHTYAVLKDPPTITLPEKELRQDVGEYSAAPDLTYVIRFDGQRLVGGKKKARRQSRSMSRCAMCCSCRDSRAFARSFSGMRAVRSRLVDRRESWDLVWKKVHGS